MKYLFHFLYPALLAGYFFTGVSFFYTVLATLICIGFALTMGAMLTHPMYKARMTREQIITVQQSRQRHFLRRVFFRTLAAVTILALFFLGKTVIATLYVINVGFLSLIAADSARFNK